MLSEPPTQITPTFSGTVGSSPRPYKNHTQPLEPLVHPPLETIMMDGRAYEIYDRSSQMIYCVVAAERHSNCTWDVAFTLVGKDDPKIKNTEVSAGHPKNLEEILDKFLKQIMIK